VFLVFFVVKIFSKGEHMRRLIASLGISAAIVALVVSAGAQTPAPAPGQAAPAKKKGIQPLAYPILPIGSQAPDFALPGTDGKTHRLSEFSSAKILGVVFESNHCPTSQLYEGRIKKLYDDYKSKGLQFVTINPNNPKSVRYDEMGYTDMNDSLPEMKLRAAFRGIQWPYLYDGETQAISMKYGVVATPHIYLFDQSRKLVYQGRIDDAQNETLVKTQDARNALDAMVAGRPVPVAETPAFGCTTKWLSKSNTVEQEMDRIKAAPVTLNMVTADDVKKARANATDKPTLLYIWSSGNAASVNQFPGLMATHYMYNRERGFSVVTISTDPHAKMDAALAVLKKEYMAGPNMHFMGDHAALQSALGVNFRAGAPLMLVIAPGGKIAYQKEGQADIIQARRHILVNMPDKTAYVGSQAYWTAAVAAKK
jgi:thiol-disulfide isomerase/thioredoxin